LQIFIRYEIAWGYAWDDLRNLPVFADGAGRGPNGSCGRTGSRRNASPSQAPPIPPPSWSKKLFFHGVTERGRRQIIAMIEDRCRFLFRWSLPPNACLLELGDSGNDLEGADSAFAMRDLDSSSLCAKARKLPAKRGKFFGEWNQGVSEKFSRGGVDIKKIRRIRRTIRFGAQRRIFRTDEERRSGEWNVCRWGMTDGKKAHLAVSFFACLNFPTLTQHMH
jgi:hypothetical protein